jgi:TonB family protein
VRPDGSVADAKIISSTGHAAWPAAVLEAVRSWQFEHSANGFTKDLPFTRDVDRD